MAPALWRTAHKNAGVKPRLGGAYDDGIVRYMKRLGGGWEKLRAALDVLVLCFPHKMYKLSQESSKPWFTLEWLLRMEDSKGNPVNRPAEILEGGWTEDQQPEGAKAARIATKPCPECGVVGPLHIPTCSLDPKDYMNESIMGSWDALPPPKKAG